WIESVMADAPPSPGCIILDASSTTVIPKRLQFRPACPRECGTHRARSPSSLP
ncbi:hypothetical protein P7K49_007093, partial [Saguinus oedipus]